MKQGSRGGRRIAFGTSSFRANFLSCHFDARDLKCNLKNDDLFLNHKVYNLKQLCTGETIKVCRAGGTMSVYIFHIPEKGEEESGT